MKRAAAAISISVGLVAAAGAVAAAETESGAVKVARATAMPDCTLFVDAATKGGDGTAQKPFKQIADAVAAAEAGAVICVAEGTYAEELAPGDKSFTLAGGFKSGAGFKVRDSAKHVSRAKGKGGSFLRFEDPAPAGDQLTAIDGFEIAGYSQAIVRDYWQSQRLDVTNNLIRDNVCKDNALAGGGLALNNVSGTIRGNVFSKNKCGRGGAVFLNDSTNQNKVVLEANRVEGNAGMEPDSAHGGAFYLFGNTLVIEGNEFVDNTVTRWGGGLYVGAYTQGNQPTTATLSRNVYRGNRAGDSGGGFFCDDGAQCTSGHEVYEGNCGGNILVDGGAGGSGPTVAKFDHVTSVGALDVGCRKPGTGMFVDTYEGVAADVYSVTNAIFWGNAPGHDLATSCSSGCQAIKIEVSHSMVQTMYAKDGIGVTFGAGNVAPADPLFAAPGKGDFRLGPGSPAAGKGSDGSDLGAHGEGGRTAEAPAEAKAAAERPAASPPEKEEDAPPPAKREPEQAEALQVKEAFEAAKELGTVEAWEAFLESYPTGFHANLARAYVKKLGSAEKAADQPKTDKDEPARSAAPKSAEPKSAEKKSAESESGDTAAAEAAPPIGPIISRGAKYMGFAERFNRYYTDKSWKPSRTVYVAPDGGGDGTSRDAPMSVADAVSGAKAGTKIHFLRGKYAGCYDFSKETSGTYDAPILLYAERNDDQTTGVSISCCADRQACFNFEAADYIAVDGFELIGGKYGVRAVGSGYPASEHSRGIAVLGSVGRDQDKDPLFSGQSDWNVWERNLAYGAKEGDGHGIYISNGSDWNIVRLNQTYANDSSDFQINADPASTCEAENIPFDDPRCDAYAGEGEGGQGASDYFLVDGNYFHHSKVGPNFTSVRRSIVRNNIFGPQTRHNASFWQETDNPKLGSSDNKILHNLFITNGRHGLKFEAHSTRNEVVNNILLGIEVKGGKVLANPSALLMEVDDTTGDNAYARNLYVSGRLEGRKPGEGEIVREDFEPSWFASFPTTSQDINPSDLAPSRDAPFLGLGTLSTHAPFDRQGTARAGKVDLGPIEVP